MGGIGSLFSKDVAATMFATVVQGNLQADQLVLGTNLRRSARRSMQKFKTYVMGGKSIAINL